MQEVKYTLTWHTYADHLRDILKELRSDESFADVTLVTDDKKQIKAHRNIIISCLTKVSTAAPSSVGVVEINRKFARSHASFN